jgi:anti-sigma factor RsiW
MKCDDAIRELPLLLYGELSFDEEEALEAHLQQCPGCQTELSRVKALHAALDDGDADVPPAMLAACRQRLRSSVGALAGTVPVRRSGVLGWFQDVLSADWTNWLRPAGAVALVAIGFFSSRLIREPEGSVVTPAVTTLGALQEPVASRVRLVEPERNGAVRIVVEETRQRVLSGNAGDEDIRRALLTAARESSDPGLRVDSVDILGSTSETAEVRTLLLYALQHDSNPGVRLKALSGLRGSASDPETRKTLARVLLTDDNPGVRTQAIDLLIERKAPDVVGVLQEALRRDDNNYVRLKCQRALHEMRASAESF